MNNSIKVPNFHTVSEFLYDEYLEYFKEFDEKFFISNIEDIYSSIISNEQREFLKFMLDKYPLNKPNKMLVLLHYYRGKDSPKEILEIILQNNKYLINDFTRNDCYIKLLKMCSYEFILEIHKIRQKNNIPEIKINILQFKIYDFYDRKVYFWLLDLIIKNNNNKSIFSCFRKILNFDKNDILKYIYYNLEYYKTSEEIFLVLEKFNLDKSILNDIFIIGYKENKLRIREIIRNIAIRKELLYKIFQIVNPKLLIPSENIALYLTIDLITYPEVKYESFMFISIHIINLGYGKIFNDLGFNSPAFFTKDIDEQKVYELIKLNKIPPKKSKFYYYYKQIINNPT